MQILSPICHVLVLEFQGQEKLGSSLSEFILILSEQLSAP